MKSTQGEHCSLHKPVEEKMVEKHGQYPKTIYLKKLKRILASKRKTC